MTEQAARYVIEPDPDGKRPGFEARPSLILRAHPVPYYAQLAEILREGILRGVWRPSEAIPSEGDLGTFFGVSRTVVRQALRELVADGLVNTQKGRGTFVSAPKDADLVVHEIRGFVEEMRARGRDVQTEVLDISVGMGSPLVASVLDLETGADVVHLTRVRSVDGEPIVRVETYLPLERCEAVLDADLVNESLYEILARECDVIPSGGWRRVEAALAGHEVASELGVAPGSPLLILAAATKDRSGRPFEYFRAAYRGDRTRFELEVSPAALKGDKA